MNKIEQYVQIHKEIEDEAIRVLKRIYDEITPKYYIRGFDFLEYDYFDTDDMTINFSGDYWIDDHCDQYAYEFSVALLFNDDVVTEYIKKHQEQIDIKEELKNSFDERYSVAVKEDELATLKALREKYPNENTCGCGKECSYT